MKKTLPKKLKLSVETVRILNTDDLRTAAGAGPLKTRCTICASTCREI